MAKDYTRESSFQAGEISPLFYGQTESEFYQKGLAIAENVVVDKRGGAFRRGGNENRGQISGNDGRIFTKQIHNYRFDSIILHNIEMVIVAPGIDFQSANLLANPLFYSSATSWTVVATSSSSRAIFDGTLCRLKPEQNNGTRTVEIRQQVTVTAATTANHMVRVQQADNAILTVKIGTTAGANNIAEFVSNEETFDGIFVPNNATYWVTVQSDGNNSLGSRLIFVGTIADADKGGVGKTYVAPWTEDQLDRVQIVSAPDGETLYFLHGNVSTRKITYVFATDAYTAVTTVSFTAPPAEWTGTNHPAAGTHTKGRLWLAGTPAEPQTVWGSKSASPEDFTTGAGAADSWNFTLEQQGRIKWLAGSKGGSKGVLIGAENGEHTLTSESGVVSQTDFDVDQQSAYGSNDMQPIQAGEKLLYFTPDGRKIQSMSYEWQQDNWLSQDLSFASEHITEGEIKRRAWAQHPGSVLVLVLGNGNISILTFDRTSQTVGWARSLFADMDILDAAVGLIGGVSRLVTLGQRTVDEIEIEIENSTEIYLDSYSHVYYATPANTVTGLDHLEGEVVQVLNDGAVEPAKTVSSGSITTERNGSNIYAGKQILSKMVTLPPDVPQGQIRSWKKRWNKIWALMHLSAPPIINGTRPPDRTPSTLMDTPEPLVSKQYQVVNLGWDEQGQVTLEENLPVAMKVLAIYGELSRESL